MIRSGAPSRRQGLCLISTVVVKASLAPNTFGGPGDTVGSWRGVRAFTRCSADAPRRGMIRAPAHGPPTAKGRLNRSPAVPVAQGTTATWISAEMAGCTNERKKDQPGSHCNGALLFPISGWMCHTRCASSKPTYLRIWAYQTHRQATPGMAAALHWTVVTRRQEDRGVPLRARWMSWVTQAEDLCLPRHTSGRSQRTLARLLITAAADGGVDPPPTAPADRTALRSVDADFLCSIYIETDRENHDPTTTACSADTNDVSNSAGTLGKPHVGRSPSPSTPPD